MADYFRIHPFKFIFYDYLDRKSYKRSVLYIALSVYHLNYRDLTTLALPPDSSMKYVLHNSWPFLNLYIFNIYRNILNIKTQKI